MQNNKTPEIRFKRFTDDWEQRKLSNLVDFSKGAGYSKNDLVESGTPIILYGRLYTRYETRISNVDTFVNALDNSVYSEGGEVIVPASGETAEDISRASVVGEKGIILGGDLNILMPRKEIDSVFLALTLSHGKQQREISKVAQGKTIVHIHNDDLRKVDLSYPANEIEQKKIGQYFLNLDNLITLHQRKHDKLISFKKAMLEKMFPKENEKVPEIRFQGFTDDWEQRKLGEFGKATGGTSLESEFVEKGNYKVISIGSYSETSKYNNQGLRTNKTPKTESKILNKDDLTMILNDKTAAGNIIGRVLLIDADNSYVYNQRTERIEVYKEDFEPSFLYQLLNAENIRSKIIKASQGNTQIYVNWSSISELEYLIPKVKSEQKKIATILNNLDNLITLHQCKLEKLKNIKKSMLEKMFV